MDSPKQGWIKFFHEKGTPDAKTAEQENSAHQLLVHGLPGEFLESTPGGPQEKALNKLLTNLGKEAIGDWGITLEQEHIIDAHPIEPSSNSDKGTLLLNEGIPRAYRGKKLRLKNILLLPFIFEAMNSF